MDPVPAIAKKEPSAILIFLLPTQGVQEENKLEQPVMLSVVPESIIQEEKELQSTLQRAAFKELPDRAKEQEKLEKCED